MKTSIHRFIYIYIYIYKHTNTPARALARGKLKAVPLQVDKRRGRCTAIAIHDSGANRRAWLTPQPVHFALGKENQYPLYRRVGGPRDRSRWVRKISPPPWFKPRTVHPVASRYTDYDIPVAYVYIYIYIYLFIYVCMCPSVRMSRSVCRKLILITEKWK
jgi:hypothetical protein